MPPAGHSRVIRPRAKAHASAGGSPRTTDAHSPPPRTRSPASPDPDDAPSQARRDRRFMSHRPNVLVILTDQQHYPPPYESDELAEFRREHLPGVERLRENGVSFVHHYPMSAACAPSRASLLTGHYPSLHGVTQTDGIAKTPDDEDM